MPCLIIRSNDQSVDAISRLNAVRQTERGDRKKRFALRINYTLKVKMQ